MNDERLRLRGESKFRYSNSFYTKFGNSFTRPWYFYYQWWYFSYQTLVRDFENCDLLGEVVVREVVVKSEGFGVTELLTDG